MTTQRSIPVNKLSRSKFSRNSNLTDEVKPVIKISLEGFLISANTTGIDFLEMLSDTVKIPAVNFLLSTEPSLLNPNCNLDVAYRISNTKYFFSAVAFKEAGYVGLYGFRQVHVKNILKISR